MFFTRHSLTAVGLLVAAMLMLPAAASADTSSSLTIVGTSDVSDSGLFANVIQPGFNAQYPQYTVKYNGSATGVAINSAEAGTGGPSVLIVHAASLENQFVAGGYSYNNAYGNAIFRNDFVLAGPGADPAGVKGNAANNIAQAFADIASAGVLGKATFVTRGGTNTAPGTTVEEHAIWQLVNDNKLTPSGVVLCTVSTADGGGMSPIKPSVQSTSGQPCPTTSAGTTGTVDSTDAPSWYVVNAGANQAKNVETANTCSGIGSGSGTCYVLSDRGTVDYLFTGGTQPATPSQIPNLSILTRDNSASAPGGQFALINYFHAYIINPNKTGETVNLAAAQAFVNYLTSNAFQSSLASYLASTPDTGGAPFVADASPTITATGAPATDPAGTPVTITGTVQQNEIGYPAIAGATVSLYEIISGVPVAVPGASATTSNTGGYSITFTPTTTGTYQLTTPQISQIENTSLTPQYGDVLSSAASAPININVQSTVTISSAKGSKSGVTVSGTVAPAAPSAGAQVTLSERTAGSTGAFASIGTATLAANGTTFSISASLPAGKYQVEASYFDTGLQTTGTSAPVNVTVGATKAKPKPKPKPKKHKKTKKKKPTSTKKKTKK